VKRLSDNTDVMAFFKLCFIDITESTDVDGIIEYYKEKVLLL